MLPPNQQPIHPASVLRHSVTSTDRDAVRRIVTATGFFRPDEVDIAVELVDERLSKGERSGYEFVFAEVDDGVAGYACYGPIGCTIGSFDLYWIAVDPAQQGRGLGRLLIAEVERRIAAAGGRTVYAETSGRRDYEPTRTFYQRCGYHVASVLPDFYDIGDDKVTFSKPCGT